MWKHPEAKLWAMSSQCCELSRHKLRLQFASADAYGQRSAVSTLEVFQVALVQKKKTFLIQTWVTKYNNKTLKYSVGCRATVSVCINFIILQSVITLLYPVVLKLHWKKCCIPKGIKYLLPSFHFLCRLLVFKILCTVSSQSFVTCNLKALCEKFQRDLSQARKGTKIHIYLFSSIKRLKINNRCAFVCE